MKNVFKKATAVLIAAAVIFSVTAIPASAAVYRKGDVTDDEKINVNDVVMLRNIIFNEDLTEQQHWAGDMNLDGKLNITDIILLREKVMRMAEPAPVLDPEKEQNLVNAFYSFMKPDNPYLDFAEVSVTKYYGTFSNCEIAYYSGIGYPMAMRRVKIAGFLFIFGTYKPLYVCKESIFLPIEDAYAAGWLTYEDIAYIWNGDYAWIYDQYLHY